MKIKQSYPTVHAMTILLQVVIGGINVDFIAKGKTKALNVSFIYDMESATIVQRRWTRLSSENSRYLFQFGQTNPGSVCQSFGGVGRNIAGWLFFLSDYILHHEHSFVSFVSNFSECFLKDSLSRLGQETLFISATGADSNSDAVLNYCKHMVCEQWCLVNTMHG